MNLLAQAQDEVDLEGATQITQVFLVIGIVVMAIGYGIWYLRKKKSET